MVHNADTVADPPYWMASPSKPKLKLPPGACDAHVHVFGPRKRFPFADGRYYTPSDATKEMLFALHERLGVQHCVIVQPACHGTDNSVTTDATAATGHAYKGVGLVPLTISDAELQRLDAAGLCGARFHYMTHLAKGPGINEVVVFAKRLADIGWHLQIHTEAKLIAELTPALKRSPAPVVVDHMGRVDASLGLNHPDFRALLALLDDENVWVKVSGSDRVTPTRYRSPGSWCPNLAIAASGAPTGRIPIMRGRSPTTAFWSISSRTSPRPKPRAGRCSSVIRSASIVLRRRAP